MQLNKIRNNVSFFVYYGKYIKVRRNIKMQTAGIVISHEEVTHAPESYK
jgi:hypothetical protein